MSEYRDPTPEAIKAAEAFMEETGRGSKSVAEFQARIKWAIEKPGNEAIAETIRRMGIKAAVDDFWPTRFDGMSEYEKFEAARTMARKRGWELHKTAPPHANDLNKYTLVREGGKKKYYATIDEVLAAIERVKPPA